MIKTKIPIALSKCEDIKDFVNIMNKYDFDIDLRKHGTRYMVDAKSLLGVMSIDTSKDCEIHIFCEDDEDITLSYLLTEIEKYRR